MSFVDLLVRAKEELKSSPIKILKQPQFWLFIPIIAFRALWIRIRYNYRIVYCTETDFESLFKILKTQNTDSAELEVLSDLTSISILANFHEVSNQSKTDSIIKDYKTRIKHGDRCFLLRINQMPVSFLWVATGEIFIDTTNSLHKLSDKCCAIYNVYTNSFFRGKGYYHLLLNLSLKQLSYEGLSKVWLWVMQHNIVSIKAHDKLGFKRINYEISSCSYLGITKHRIRRVDYPILDLLK